MISQFLQNPKNSKMDKDQMKKIAVNLLTVTAGVLIAFKIKELFDKAKLAAPVATAKA